MIGHRNPDLFFAVRREITKGGAFSLWIGENVLKTTSNAPAAGKAQGQARISSTEENPDTRVRAKRETEKKSRRRKRPYATTRRQSVKRRSVSTGKRGPKKASLLCAYAGKGLLLCTG
jgi:hypothetical protein